MTSTLIEKADILAKADIHKHVKADPGVTVSRFFV